MLNATQSNSFTEFSGHAFHQSLNRGRSSGVLRVSASGFYFLIDGEEKVRLPLQGATLTLGGASDRVIFISHPEEPGWSLYTSDRGLLNHAGLNSVPALAAQLRKMRGKRRQNWFVLAGVCAAILLLPLLFIFNMDRAAALVAEQVPRQWEVELGKSAYAQYRIQNELLEEQQAEQLLAGLTDRLTEQLPESSYDFQFAIVNDASLNAFALPGGFIVIHSGLIMKAESADELLGVLAHEIAHVTEQHGLRSVITSAGIVVVFQALLGDASGLLAMVASATPMLLNLQYSRAFEREADELGVALLQKADINPRGLVTFFEKMIAEERVRLEKIENKDAAEVLGNMPEFLSTHPATAARIERIEKLIQPHPSAYRDLRTPFLALQEQVKNFVTEPSENDSGAPNEQDSMNRTQ